MSVRNINSVLPIPLRKLNTISVIPQNNIDKIPPKKYRTSFEFVPSEKSKISLINLIIGHTNSEIIFSIIALCLMILSCIDLYYTFNPTKTPTNWNVTVSVLGLSMSIFIGYISLVLRSRKANTTIGTFTDISKE